MKSVSQPPKAVVKLNLPSEKAPRPAEAAHGIADLALDTVLHLAGHDGAAAAVDVAPLLQDHHLQLRISAHQLIARVDTGLSAADDGNVVSLVHHCSYSFCPVGTYSIYFSIPWSVKARNSALDI